MGIDMSKVSRIGPQSLLQLRIELTHSSPLIWRVILVPENITLMKLHRIIQEIMGWEDYHLHEFIINHERYGLLELDDMFLDLESDVIDEKRKKLTSVLGNQHQFEYIYDFGDHWSHQITLEGKLALRSDQPIITCVAGEMACPPEDVGSMCGYYDFLEAINDPSHDEHESMVEWWGGTFDPTAFDINQVNKWLSKIK